jgi:hypothetical protein
MRVAFWRTAAASAVLVISFGGARGAVYDNSFTVNPANLSCGYFGTLEICSFGRNLSPSIPAAMGDQFNESVTFTSPLIVPPSAPTPGGQDTVFFNLVDGTEPGGPPAPGADSATITSTLLGYIGPSGKATFISSISGGYLGLNGFYNGTPGGFSVTGMTFDFTITGADPHPIVSLGGGYSVTLPATPELISDIHGGTIGHPALLPPGEIGQLTVPITAEFPQDYYHFEWPGGVFQAQASVADAPAGSSYLYQLLDLSGDVLAQQLLDSADDFTAEISASLDPDLYTVGVSADSPTDPTLTLTFSTPVSGAVPESSTWAMMALSFAGLGFVGYRRAKRRRRLAR